MEKEEQPAAELTKEERIEAHFTTPNDHWNKYTFEIYNTATDNGLFFDVEVPLDAFTHAEGFLFTNRTKPLSAVKALMNDFDEQGPPFADEQKRFMLTHLISYFSGTVYSDNDGKEISLKKIESLLKRENDKLHRSEVDNSINTSFDWQAAKTHLATLPDTTAKIAYLIEQKAEYEQRGGDGLIIEWFGPEYDKKCQTEINKLKALAQLEQQEQAAKSPFKVAGKKGSKTDLIRVLNALYELHLIELENGQRLTKKQFMQQVGGFLGIDMKSYEQTLSKALEQPIEANAGVFEKLQQISQAQVVARGENSRK
ncbi:hypothetical protein J2I47_15200 [Fibrella sp. HMF5335]|uniref:Uncharacterized protein n=1 Tax=Fibrella rubiginis TaxID=2817060 RepID=A0A939GHJ6_9BACT|nr:hypothetical protein [Fibrella rubiginis]MBO0937903.1 hypothetical protein [Fibrella rubiginis]